MSNDDKKSGHNPLADQLADLDIEVSDGDKKDQERKGRDTGQKPDQSPSRRREDKRKLSDEELFQQAMENMDPDDFPTADDQMGTDSSRPEASKATGRRSSAPEDSDDEPTVRSDRELFEQAVDNIDAAEVYEAKFRGGSGAAGQLPDDDSGSSAHAGGHSASAGQSAAGDDPVDEEQARQDIEQLRQEAMFHRAVSDAKPLSDRDKYHFSRRRRAASSDEQDCDDDALLTPSLPTSGDGLNYVSPPGKAQKAMLQRFQRWNRSHDHLPELVVRGLTRDEALDQLRDFIERYHSEETRFVRIVPGRGLRSKTEPILKPTVLKWLEGPGRPMICGYVPERLQGGDYGSLIVELDF